MTLGCVAVMLLLAPPLLAQDKPPEKQEQARLREPALEVPGIPLRVQVVFSESQGERKISNLPYVLHLVTQDDRSRTGSPVKLRMGLRVPIQTGKEGQFQYLELGTNIDCWAQRMSDGRFRLYLSVSRSSSYSPEGQAKPELAVAPGPTPIFGQFSAELNLLLQDGATMQSVVATDPVSGRTLKVDVTLNVVK
jgi:hypothetical protein